MTETHRVVSLFALAGAGLSAGSFFAFSTFVMPALHALPARSAVAAMQSINRSAPNPLFVAAMFVPLPLGAWLSWARRGEPGQAFAVAGTACVLAGLLVLMGYHVPHNDELGRVSPDAADLGSLWQRYYGGWTVWNHVRTAVFSAATVLFALSLRAD